MDFAAQYEFREGLLAWVGEKCPDGYSVAVAAIRRKTEISYALNGTHLSLIRDYHRHVLRLCQWPLGEL